MTTIYQQFKSSFISGVFSLTAKNIWKYILIAVIQNVVGLLVMLPILFSVIDFSAFEGIMEDPDAWGRQIGENPELLFSFLGEDPNYTSLILTGSLAVIASLIVASWTYHIGFILNDDAVRFKKSDLGSAFSRSFSNRVFRIFGLMLVIYVLAVVIGLIFFVGAGVISGWLVVIGAILFYIVILRFTVALPAMVHEDLSIGDSISRSFQYITWKRSAILMLGIIIAGLAIMVTFFIVGLFVGIISLIPFIGQMISLSFNIVVGGVMLCLALSTMSGLYFRYSSIEVGSNDDDLTDHLITRTN